MAMIAAGVATAGAEIAIQVSGAALESMNSRTQQVGEQATEAFNNANDAFSKDVGSCVSPDFSGPNAGSKEDLMKPTLASHPELWNKAP